MWERARLLIEGVVSKLRSAIGSHSSKMNPIREEDACRAFVESRTIPIHMCGSHEYAKQQHGFRERASPSTKPRTPRKTFDHVTAYKHTPFVGGEICLLAAAFRE